MAYIQRACCPVRVRRAWSIFDRITHVDVEEEEKKLTNGTGIEIWTWTRNDILSPHKRHPFAFIHKFVVLLHGCLNFKLLSGFAANRRLGSMNYDFVYNSVVNKTMPPKRHSILSIHFPRGEICMMQANVNNVETNYSVNQDMRVRETAHLRTNDRSSYMLLSPLLVRTFVPLLYY